MKYKNDLYDINKNKLKHQYIINSESTSPVKFDLTKMYTHTHTHIYMYIYIYIHIHIRKERSRELRRLRECNHHWHCFEKATLSIVTITTWMSSVRLCRHSLVNCCPKPTSLLTFSTAQSRNFQSKSWQPPTYFHLQTNKKNGNKNRATSYSRFLEYYFFYDSCCL